MKSAPLLSSIMLNAAPVGRFVSHATYASALLYGAAVTVFVLVRMNILSGLLSYLSLLLMFFALATLIAAFANAITSAVSNDPQRSRHCKRDSDSRVKRQTITHSIERAKCHVLLSP